MTSATGANHVVVERDTSHKFTGFYDQPAVWVQEKATGQAAKKCPWRRRAFYPSNAYATHTTQKLANHVAAACWAAKLSVEGGVSYSSRCNFVLVPLYCNACEFGVQLLNDSPAVHEVRKRSSLLHRHHARITAWP